MDNDHTHGSASGSGGPIVTCPMIMAFHGGHCERILWKSWVVSTLTGFILSCVAIFTMAFLYEALKFLREYLQRQAERSESERVALEIQAKGSGVCIKRRFGDKSFWQHVVAGPHLLQTFLNVVQVLISYLLMLVFMTFNYWLCLVVVLGLGFGYFCFGWISRSSYENECCQ